MAESTGRPSEKNGAVRAPLGLALADGALVYDDPMSKVLGLDAQSSSPVAWLGYYLGALTLLLGMMVTARVVTVVLESMNREAVPAQIAPQEIEVMRDEPPPPPPPAPEPEAKPEEAPPPPAPVAKAVPHDAPPPAPAPAQAAKVLTQEPDPNEPVDLTGNTIVQGNADAYAGGTTSANGTSTRAVRALASPNGVPNGAGTSQAKHIGPDLSRPASVGDTEWSAPFPAEADSAQIDDTHVTLSIDVRADGTAAAVRILKDPGYGFGREAKKYALSQHFRTALDADGNPISFTIKNLVVHFQR
jgi:periplasmic protein TonB